MPYRIGTSQQTAQGKTAVNIEGPGIQAPGLRLSFASPNDSEAFVIGLDFAFARLQSRAGPTSMHPL